MAIEPPWDVESPILAAGNPEIKTEEEPLDIVSTLPTQKQEEPTVAAGSPPIITFVIPWRMGPPTWGTGTAPGFDMGQLWKSVCLAAAGIINLFEQLIL